MNDLLQAAVTMGCCIAILLVLQAVPPTRPTNHQPTDNTTK